jgi:predicted porin
MQKKLMAVAVAGALAAPGVVLAQASTVQIGGGINMLYYQHTPHNDSVGRKGDILEQSESELFIKGTEALGGGLTAWFQCTSSFEVSTGNKSGPGADGAGIGAGAFCTRNSGLGFQGSFGNVFGGNWDMPQKLVVNRIRGAFSGTNALYGGSMNLINGGSASGTNNPIQATVASIAPGAVVAAVPFTVGGATTTSNNPAQFYRRQANSWNYHSPVWSGFQVQAAYSATNETTGIPAASSIKPRLWSAALHYDNGPLYLGLGYEQHQDYNPGNSTTQGIGASQYNGGTDRNWILGAGYTFAGKFKLTGMYLDNKYDVTNTGTLKKKGWALFGDWNIAGPHILRAAYANAGDSKGNTSQAVSAHRSPLTVGGNTGGQWWSIHYAYQFSKRTEGLIGYNRMNNDTNAVYSLGKTAPTLGASQSAMGIALKHKF